MDLALLRTFLTVHRAGSFTRAATLLGLSQPAVTGQIRTLERQLGRPLFLRRPRGVAPTAVGRELAHRVAPHLDALLEITEGEAYADSARRTVHLAGPPEFTAQRALPALAPLAERGPTGGGLALRATFGTAESVLEDLAAGHCDLAVSTARPRGGRLTATPLCDEEQVLVAAPRWAARLRGAAVVRARGPRLLAGVPALDVHESLPLLAHYWSAAFDTPLHRPGAHRSGTVVAPDLRGVLECAAAGAGMAALPRYLCTRALDAGEVVVLCDPPVPPLRTYFLSVRTGTLALPHLAQAYDWLLRAGADWV